MLLHDRQDLDDDLGSGPDEHLPLASSFGVDDVVQTVVEYGDTGHLEGMLCWCLLRYGRARFFDEYTTGGSCNLARRLTW